ncbi:aromatic ring-opening dioxygenase LigA [Herbiconiux sp. A18JL235]|uniref:Aromatic ring-opening dioxygenase LigA n=1 Tax=Herbiconiux sp. A18JL235 TaxID=3152363 RepID=A0AB39BK15_9MICO
MPTSTTTDALARAGGFTLAAGAVFVAAGATAWTVVTRQLRAEKIEVPGNAPAFAGKPVQGPATAYVEALVIKGNAERGAGGRTFADISAALREVAPGSDEAAELRKQSMSLSTAASLRTALMTSVLAYGVSALVTGLGAFFVVTGSVLRRAGR